jgi:hypothetical protein
VARAIPACFRWRYRNTGRRLPSGRLAYGGGRHASNSEANRKLKERAVRIDAEVVEDAQRIFSAGFEGVLQVGKRNFASYPPDLTRAFKKDSQKGLAGVSGIGIIRLPQRPTSKDERTPAAISPRRQPRKKDS